MSGEPKVFISYRREETAGHAGRLGEDELVDTGWRVVAAAVPREAGVLAEPVIHLHVDPVGLRAHLVREQLRPRRIADHEGQVGNRPRRLSRRCGSRSGAGPQHHRWGDLLIGQPGAERQGDHQAGRGQGLHHDEGPQVERDRIQQWALAGISFQGLTMAVVGDKFVGYAAFDSVTDANRAAAILGDLGASNP